MSENKIEFAEVAAGASPEIRAQAEKIHKRALENARKFMKTLRADDPAVRRNRIQTETRSPEV